MLFRFSAPKIGQVLTKTFSKGSFTRFFQKMAPREGGGVLPDFTRRGTNYLNTTLLKTHPKSNFLDSERTLLGFSGPEIRGVLTKTFSKGSFTVFSKKWHPGGGGAFDQISPDVALTTCIQPYSKRSQNATSWSIFFQFGAPKIGGVLTKTFSKDSFTRSFQKMAPGGGVLQDFTRCGTNYLHTTLLKTYPKSNFLDSNEHFVWIRRPQNKGGPHKNIFKGLIYPFFKKIAHGGAAFYQISPHVALTTCMQLLVEMTPAICQYQQHSLLKLRNNSEVCMIQSPVQCLGCRKCEEHSNAQMLLPCPRIRQINSNALMISAPSVNQKHVTGLQKGSNVK